jgi:uncharacterized protein YoaH (UPF0181 family)
MIFNMGTTSAIQKVAKELRKIRINLDSLVKHLQKEDSNHSKDEDDEHSKDENGKNQDVIWGVEWLSTRPDKPPKEVYENKREAFQVLQKEPKPSGKCITKYKECGEEWELTEWWVLDENDKLEKGY